MITVSKLVAIFTEKLVKTGSFDAAFTKAVWVAYKEGVKDGQYTHKEKHHG
jgi:hypothetical protein